MISKPKSSKLEAVACGSSVSSSAVRPKILDGLPTLIHSMKRRLKYIRNSSRKNCPRDKCLRVDRRAKLPPMVLNPLSKSSQASKLLVKVASKLWSEHLQNLASYKSKIVHLGLTNFVRISHKSILS